MKFRRRAAHIRALVRPRGSNHGRRLRVRRRRI